MSPVRHEVARRLFYRHRYRVAAAAAALSALAGYVNAITLALTHYPVSHQTGSIARMGQDLAVGQNAELALSAGIVGAFLLGAVAAGAIVGTRRLLPGRRYGVALVVEGALLAASALTLAAHPAPALLLAAAASGLQNGMATSFYGVIVRTTHVSGILTDLGVLAGHWLRRRPVQGWRAAFQASIVAGFAIGSVGGAVAARRAGAAAMLVPPLVCVVGGIGYIGLTSREARRRAARRARAVAG